MNKELSYWLALAHTPKVKTKKKNEIIVRLFEQGNTIIDFFHSDFSSWNVKYGLTPNEVELFKSAYQELPNYAFLVEDLLEQGYNILPITSQDYSPILKKNLGRSYAPPLLYTKGNLQILKEKSVAIVGSRKANNISLEFTDNIAQNASKDYKVIVSGFAKGVDKQALDSAIKYKGQSIIVLPQGITTFKTGYKKYYKEIIEGDVLVLSTFYPKAPWSVQFAMARNPIIYGLASEIYVAESSEKGGTWSGVIDGIRKGRDIYVRKPTNREKNANGILISKGAKAVDQKGFPTIYEISSGNSSILSESELSGVEYNIIELLKQGTFDSKFIVEKLNINWSARKVTSFLKKNSEIEIIKGKPMKFTHKSRISDGQTTLF
ncbi:MAG: DNA transporter [Flavobacteriaceae bacterium]|nr:DNA transporter [Flavobacteriaceae bacterium]